MPEKIVTVPATQLWFDTGVTVVVDSVTRIEALSGTWTANPDLPRVDAGGHPAYVAKDGYNLPGENEGALIGSVEETIFLVGNRPTDAPVAGLIYLSINDDVFAQYGAGFDDNEGALEVRVSWGPPTVMKALTLIRETWPATWAERGEEDLRAAVERGLTAAAGFGLTDEREALIYINVMVALGEDFPSQYPWAADTLNADILPATKADLLLEDVAAELRAGQ